MEDAVNEVTLITGQKPIITKSKKAIANFKLREGENVGVKVTLRGGKMYDFMMRLVRTAIPRIRDFRGVAPRSFDGRGNYTLGVPTSPSSLRSSSTRSSAPSVSTSPSSPAPTVTIMPVRCCARSACPSAPAQSSRRRGAEAAA
jgi:hypothetical protein